MAEGVTDARALLAACGEALYGPRWQSDMARGLGVNPRSVRDWVAGQSRPRPGVWLDLMRLMQERAATLDDLVERARQAPAP